MSLKMTVENVEFLEEQRLNEEFPLDDQIGNIADEARHSENRALRYVSGLLGVLLLGSMAMNIVQSHRPALVRWVRIDSIAQATPIQYSDLTYSPRDAEIMKQLTEWAQLRFGRIRSTVLRNHSRSNYFLDRNYSAQLAQEEQRTQEIAKVATGETPESDVNVKHVQITRLDHERFGTSILYSGSAQILMENVSAATNEKQKRIVSLNFFLNPEDVSRLAEKDPEYLNINPLGLVITEMHVAGF